MILHQERGEAPATDIITVTHPEGGDLLVSVSLDRASRRYYIDEHPAHFIDAIKVCITFCGVPGGNAPGGSGCGNGKRRLRRLVEDRLVEWGYPTPGVRGR